MNNLRVAAVFSLSIFLVSALGAQTQSAFEAASIRPANGQTGDLSVTLGVRIDGAQIHSREKSCGSPCGTRACRPDRENRRVGSDSGICSRGAERYSGRITASGSASLQRVGSRPSS